MSKSQTTVHLELPPLSPSALAKLEIMGLASDPELSTICIVGRGSLTKEQEAENHQRAELRTTTWLAIIKKHGVEEEYLEPLLKERARLWSELSAVCRKIEMIRT